MNLKKVRLPSAEKIRKEILRRKLESDFLAFVKYMFKHEYNMEFIESWHHKTLCTVMEKIYKGKLRNVIINISPRQGKTEIVVKMFIAWTLAKAPHSKYIHLSYSQELALDNSSQAKELVMSDTYQNLWPVVLKSDAKGKGKWYTEDGGGVYATAAGGAVTGFGAGHSADDFGGAILIDDPLKSSDASSDTIRTTINDRFNNTIKSRLNNPSKTPVILVQQRLHEDDMAGFLLNNGSELKFEHINLPSINEDGPSEYDPREIGEALWPAKHTVEMLEQMRKYDPKTFAGQYQQSPMVQDGNIISRNDLMFYKDIPMNQVSKIILSWDFTFKDSKNSDFVVGTAFGLYKNNIYLLDCTRARMSFTKSLDAMKSMVEKYPKYHALLVEDKANGSAIIDTAKRQLRKIIPINPDGSKQERFEACAPLFEAHNIFFPDKSIAPWIDEFTNELLIFPNAKHDDRVDSLTQAVRYMDTKFMGRRSSFADMAQGNNFTNNPKVIDNINRIQKRIQNNLY